MTETPEAHAEIIEIKREIKEIRQTQDAEIHHSRKKWEDYLFTILRNDEDMMRVLLAIDGIKSAKDLEKDLGFYQVKCWRILQKLQDRGIILGLETTKKGSPVYIKSRWYSVLKLDEKVQKQLPAQDSQSQTDMKQNHAENK
jgi:predicted transcriptional regulator